MKKQVEKCRATYWAQLAVGGGTCLQNSLQKRPSMLWIPKLPFFSKPFVPSFMILLASSATQHSHRPTVIERLQNSSVLFSLILQSSLFWIVELCFYNWTRLTVGSLLHFEFVVCQKCVCLLWKLTYYGEFNSIHLRKKITCNRDRQLLSNFLKLITATCLTLLSNTVGIL